MNLNRLAVMKVNRDSPLNFAKVSPRSFQNYKRTHIAEPLFSSPRPRAATFLCLALVI